MKPAWQCGWCKRLIKGNTALCRSCCKKAIARKASYRWARPCAFAESLAKSDERGRLQKGLDAAKKLLKRRRAKKGG